MQRAMFWLFLLSLASACETSPPCTTAELREALGEASAGDVVALDACEFSEVEASVPAGVTLSGMEGTRLIGSGDVLTLEAGASLVDLDVQTRGGRGVVLLPGAHSLTNVNVAVATGVGVSGEGATGTWTNVRVEGELDPLRADSIPPLATTSSGHFLVVLEDAQVDFIDVGVLKGGPWGVIVQNGTLTWQGGFVEDVVGTGVYAADSTLTMNDVTITNMLQGIQPYPSYGVLATNTVLTTDALEIHGSEGLGLLADASTGTQNGLVVEECSFGGAWIQRASNVSFERISLLRNGLAGLVSQSSTLRIEDGAIADTELQQALFAGNRSIAAGDGVQIHDPLGVDISGLSATGNARIGLVVDLVEQPLTNVRIAELSVGGESLGALVQADGSLVSGWDSAVTRDATTQANDTAQSDALDLVGALLGESVPSL